MFDRSIARLMALLAKPAARRLFIAAAVFLVLPSLSSGLASDDYVLASQLRAPGAIPGLSRGIHDLFVFAPGEAAASHALMEQGVFPWWADPGAKIAFFRPLASLSHALDHGLLPDAPRLWHAHSILWFLLSLIAVSALYRRVLAAGPATLALLLFAFDDAHGAAIGWLSARNGLMALTFSALSLWALARWRMDAWRPGAALGPVFFALSLLSGEAAIGGCAYVASFALFLDEGPLARRLMRLRGFGAVLVVWAIVWVSLGYGTSGTTHYLDPLREPGAFLTQLVARLPVLVLAQVFLPWSDLWTLYPALHPSLPYVVWGLAMVVIAGLAIVLAPLLRRDRVARFFAFGCVVSLVPVCAGLPSDRLLLFAGIGAMALASLVVTRLFEGKELFARPAMRAFAGFGAFVIVLWHVLSNLYWLPARSQGNRFFAPVFERADSSLPSSEDVTTKTTILVNPPFEPLVYYWPFTRDAGGVPRPKRVRILGTGGAAISITRIDERTLLVRPDRGFLSSPVDTMLRSARRPMALGTAVELSDVTIEITEVTRDGRPAEARFRFRVALEDPSLAWRKWGCASMSPSIFRASARRRGSTRSTSRRSSSRIRPDAGDEAARARSGPRSGAGARWRPRGRHRGIRLATRSEVERIGRGGRRSGNRRSGGARRRAPLRSVRPVRGTRRGCCGRGRRGRGRR
jgi:hypothetical protein